MNDREDEHELDEEALSWDGDDDVVRGEDPEATRVEDQPKRGIFDVVREMSRRERVISAGFMLVALVWAVGWGVVVAQNPIRLPDTLMTVMYELGEFLAIVAAPLAAFTVIQLARGRTRMLWLAAVTIVTFPWPLIVEGIA